MLVDLPKGERPVGKVTNGQIAKDVRKRDEQVKLDNARKEELRKQLDLCR